FPEVKAFEKASISPLWSVPYSVCSLILSFLFVTQLKGDFERKGIFPLLCQNRPLKALYFKP
ncbi:hypothetical protein, partial [Mogibacterium timidum]